MEKNIHEALKLFIVGKHKQTAILKKTDVYMHLLWKWGRVYNLTANNDSGSLLPHIVDSLAIGRFISLLHVKHCADLGSGAGFPSIIAAIMNPHILFTLFEIDINKSSFLRQVIIENQLNNVVLRGDWKKRKNKFSLLLSKGFLSPENFINVLPNVLEPGGVGLICSHQSTFPTKNLIKSQFFYHYHFKSRLYIRHFLMLQT